MTLWLASSVWQGQHALDDMGGSLNVFFNSRRNLVSQMLQRAAVCLNLILLRASIFAWPFTRKQERPAMISRKGVKDRPKPQILNYNVKRKMKVVIYSRPDCHLCEEMKSEIARADCGELYLLKEIDIESDPELLRQYQYDIPVLTIDDVEAFRHRLVAEEFRAKIIAAYPRSEG